jgi:hypothetical protein
MIGHNKIIVLMQAKHFVHKLIPPGRKYEQACFVCTALFNHAILNLTAVYEVGLDFIWVVYIAYNTSVIESG